MKISQILIGNELLAGLIQDKNAVWLSKYLQMRGLELYKTLTVRDTVADIKSAISFLEKDSDLIILSGGLGPTDDDLTKFVLAEYFESPVVKRDDAFNLVKSHYDRIEKEFIPSQNRYDEMPRDFELVGNRVGLAPGLLLERKERIFLALPGVPREFQAMIEDNALRLFKKGLNQNFEKFLIRTMRVAEEKIFKELETDLWEKLSKFGNVSSLPHVLGVDIGIDLINPTDGMKEEIKEIIRKTKIAKNVWNYGPESIEEVLVNTLRAKGLTLGFCESCTGGRAAHFVTNLPGCSDVFLGSAVTYSNEAKMNILGVKEETLKNFGAVSVETAKEMAIGGKNILKADYVVSFTGIAGPTGGTVEKPVGTVAIGIAGPEGVSAELFLFKGVRKVLKERFMKQGMFSLLKLLTKN